MKEPMMPHVMIRSLVMVALLVTTTACDNMEKSSRNAAAITKKTYQNSVSFWDDVFTYHPKQADNAPQTRYCYQMQSDVVCYDSVQTSSTAKLIGYQDGENLSWVQPGGGSLGVSGGEPVALRVSNASSTSRSSSSGSASFASSGSDMTGGSISSSNLPPPPKGFSR